MIAVIPLVFYLTQLIIDILATKYTDKIGYRKCVVASQVLSSIGLISMTILPEVVSISFVGILIFVMFYAIGSGLIEVLVSPIERLVEDYNSMGITKLLKTPLFWLMIILMICSGASEATMAQ